jgi:uncharacterized protein (TIGR02217 family)
MSFDEVRFPVNISYGSDGGPVRQTNIVETGNGYESRSTSWAQSKHIYNIRYGMKNYNDLHLVKEFYEARSGPLYAFRYKDWIDYKSCAPQDTISNIDQNIGVGNSTATTFQLRKQYVSGARTYNRVINKPVTGTVIVAINGVNQTSGWTVDVTTGIITFSTPPSTGAVITAGYEFDVPVRFDSDELLIQLSSFNLGEIFDILLVEVRL